MGCSSYEVLVNYPLCDHFQQFYNRHNVKSTCSYYKVVTLYYHPVTILNNQDHIKRLI